MDLAADSSISAVDAVDDHSSGSATASSNHGWQKVTYAKRQRSQNQAATPAAGDQRSNGIPHVERTNVFASIEQKAQERRRSIESAAAAADAASVLRPAAVVAASDEDEEDSGAEGAGGTGQENEAEVAKKIKQKKPKNPKVTVHEAASRIDAADLAAYLAEVSVSYELQHDIQLMRFADYFGRAFSTVSASQFPWPKIFKESPVAKIIEVPVCHIPEAVYKTSVDWIALKSPEALVDFVLWCLDCIFADLIGQQAVTKGFKKITQKPPSKSQVAIFVVLSMLLRRKPEVLNSVLPKLMRENPQHQGAEKVSVIVWTISQASQGDLVVGVHAWAHYLLPLIYGKAGNPQTRGMALQLIESIMSESKARPILMNGAVRKGERIVPPFALDLLMRFTFPAPSARVKATERLEALYPVLKELALAGLPSSKTLKQASQQILLLATKAMQESNNNTMLAGEAASLFIWCLSQNLECYKQWEKLHMENVEASVCVLRKLCEEWKEQARKLSPNAPLRETLQRLREMNEEASSGGEDAAAADSRKKMMMIKEGDKFCKVLLGRIGRRSACLKSAAAVAAVGVALGFVASPYLESLAGSNSSISSFLTSFLTSFQQQSL